VVVRWKGTCRVRANHDLSRVSVSFDETNLVPNAGLLPAAVLAERLDVAGLVDRRLRLARHGANSGAKALSVVGSILAGGDSIDDVAVLRAGAAGSLFDGAMVQPSKGRISRLPLACTVAACPGRTSVVESISTTIAGPVTTLPACSRERSNRSASAYAPLTQTRVLPVRAGEASGPAFASAVVATAGRGPLTVARTVTSSCSLSSRKENRRSCSTSNALLSEAIPPPVPSNAAMSTETTGSSKPCPW